MDNPEGDLFDEDIPVVQFKESMKIKDVIGGGAVFDVHEDFVKLDEEEMVKPVYTSEEAQGYTRIDSIGFFDEEEEGDGSPFEIIGKRMVNLTPDGKIKKRITKPGIHSTLPQMCMVTIHYNAYLEYNDTPFDSTYIRRRPYSFRLETEEELPYLTIAVKSMQLQEKAEFLIHYDYAYGALGCKPRIPERATILFEAEVLRYVDSGAFHLYGRLNEEEKRDFGNIYRCVQAMCLIGNEHYAKGRIKQAVIEYNKGAHKLEQCLLQDQDEEDKQQKLLLRLLTNLVVSYTKLKKPRQACANTNRIVAMCKGSSKLRTPAKVYYNNAKCMTMFGDYDRANAQFAAALRAEPHNKEIQRGIAAFKREMAQCTFPYLRPNRAVERKLRLLEEIDDDFKSSVQGLCKDLNENELVVMYGLPADLTAKEIEYVESQVGDYNLRLDRVVEEGDVVKYYVIKQNEDKN